MNDRRVFAWTWPWFLAPIPRAYVVPRRDSGDVVVAFLLLRGRNHNTQREHANHELAGN